MNLVLLSFIFLNGEFPICTVPEYQEIPSVAFDGENYLVVWQDRRSGGYDIWGQFVSQEGELVDTNFAICAEEGLWYVPCVSFGAGTYLVTWDGGIDSGVVCGQRILPTGVLVDTIFSISGRKNSLEPDVSFDGTNFMVVWRDYHVGDDQVCGRIVSPAGTFVDTVFTVPVTGSGREYPHVASGDTNCLVVWQDLCPSPVSVDGCIISSGGIPTDTGFFIIGAGATAMIPDVASCGENYLVVVTTRDTLFGRFVSPAAELLEDPFAIAVEPAGGCPTAIWADTAYLVTWQQLDAKDPIDIWGRWISRQGTALGERFAICEAYHYQFGPVAAYGNGNCLVVWDDGRNFDYDIYGRIIDVLSVEERINSQLSTGNGQLSIQPNPFTHNTVMEFRVHSSEFVDGKPLTPEIYDLSGRLVRSFPITKSPNQQIIKWSWDGTDTSGNEVDSGVYFVRAGSEGHLPAKVIKL